MKQKWLIKQPERYKNLQLEIPEPKNLTIHWLKFGLAWGLFMFGIMTFLSPFLQHKSITLRSVSIGFPVWLLAGLGWGYMMKIWMNRIGDAAGRTRGNR